MPSDIRAFLNKNTKPVELKFTKAKMAKMKASAGPGEEVQDRAIVGRLGTIMSLKMKTGQKLKTASTKFRGALDLPDAWRNDVVPKPTDAEKDKYKNVDLNPTKYNLSTRPQSQGKCGSCFAFACATAISDAFVFGKNLSYNPLTSPLDILSCVNDEDCNAKCDGGNPLGVLQYLSEPKNRGIVSSRCLSYDNWVQGGNITSEGVPACAGCYTKQCGDKKPKLYQYRIKPPVFISESDAASDGTDVQGVKDAVGAIKLHLLKFGAAVTGFAVLNNFLSDPDGSFHETNGIYFENKVYDGGKGGDTKGAEKTKGDDPFVCAGGHAVCIVGWGVSAKPITLYFPNDTDPKKKAVTIQNCPYWVVRNSWGKDWGDGGYFKMAMYQMIKQDGAEYEVNPNVAFERFRSYSAKMLDEKGNVTTQDMPIGGVIMIEPSEIVEDKTETRDAPPYTNEEMKKFYCSDSFPAPVETYSPSTTAPSSSPSSPSSPSSTPSSSPSTPSSAPSSSPTPSSKQISNVGMENKGILSGGLKWMLIIILLGIVGFLIYKKYKK